jgi:hypothetical protein
MYLCLIWMYTCYNCIFPVGFYTKDLKNLRMYEWLRLMYCCLRNLFVVSETWIRGIRGADAHYHWLILSVCDRGVVILSSAFLIGLRSTTSECNRFTLALTFKSYREKKTFIFFSNFDCSIFVWLSFVSSTRESYISFLQWDLDKTTLSHSRASNACIGAASVPAPDFRLDKRKKFACLDNDPDSFSQWHKQ